MVLAGGSHVGRRLQSAQHSQIDTACDPVDDGVFSGNMRRIAHRSVLGLQPP